MFGKALRVLRFINRNGNWSWLTASRWNLRSWMVEGASEIECQMKILSPPENRSISGVSLAFPQVFGSRKNEELFVDISTNFLREELLELTEISFRILNFYHLEWFSRYDKNVLLTMEQATENSQISSSQCKTSRISRKFLAKTQHCNITNSIRRPVNGAPKIKG